MIIIKVGARLSYKLCFVTNKIMALQNSFVALLTTEYTIFMVLCLKLNLTSSQLQCRYSHSYQCRSVYVVYILVFMLCQVKHIHLSFSWSFFIHILKEHGVYEGVLIYYHCYLFSLRKVMFLKKKYTHSSCAG